MATCGRHLLANYSDEEDGCPRSTNGRRPRCRRLRSRSVLYFHRDHCESASTGEKVIWYFSGGSYEPHRPDSRNFKKKDIGNGLKGWPGEYWLNLSSPEVRHIMKKRIELAVLKGCDAIDPNNMDCYTAHNGLGLTQADSISFVTYLSTLATELRMSTDLKNAGEIIPKVMRYVHFSVNEQCHQFEDCSTYAAFIQNNKPVFNIEYTKHAPNVSVEERKASCARFSKGNATNFQTVIKTLDLDGWIEFCNGTTAYN